MQLIIVLVFELRIVTQVEYDSNRVYLLLLSVAINKVIDKRIKDA